MSSGRGALLYNVALAYDRDGADREAAEYYERYLTAEPDAENQADVERRLRVARERVARMELALEDESGTSETPPRPGPDLLGPGILGGVAGGLAIGGAIALAFGQTDARAIESIPPGTSEWMGVRPNAERADGLTAMGIAALTVGVGMGGAAIVWALTQPNDRSPPLALRLSPTGFELRGDW